MAEVIHPKSGNTLAQVDAKLAALDEYLSVDGVLRDGTFGLGNDSLGIDWQAMTPLEARRLQKDYQRERGEIVRIQRLAAKRPCRVRSAYLSS